MIGFLVVFFEFFQLYCQQICKLATLMLKITQEREELVVFGLYFKLRGLGQLVVWEEKFCFLVLGVWDCCRVRA